MAYRVFWGRLCDFFRKTAVNHVEYLNKYIIFVMQSSVNIWLF